MQAMLRGSGQKALREAVTLREAQRELRRHAWEHFVSNPPAVAFGGEGVVVPGCPTCRKRINTLSEYMDHLADDVLPILIAAVSEKDRQ